MNLLTFSLLIDVAFAATVALVLGFYVGRRFLRPTSQSGESLEHLALLRRIDRLIVRQTKFEQLAEETTEMLAETSEMLGASVSIFDPDGRVRVVAVSPSLLQWSRSMHKLLGTSKLARHSLTTEALETGKVVSGTELRSFVAPQLTAKSADAVQRELGIKTVAVYPIHVAGVVSGAVTFFLDADPVDRKVRDLMQSVSDELGVALQNARLVDRLEHAKEALERANDDLQRADAVKDEFISIASHQLRSPLTAIKGHLSMLLEGDYGEISRRQLPALKRLAQSTNEVINILNDMLSVSRINAHQLELNKTTVEPEDLVRDVVSELRPLAQLKSLKITVDLPARPIGSIQADGLRIRQVMVNFLDNAIKYTPRGHVKVTLSRQKDNLIFLVKDNGIGIPETELQKLFSKFYRASNAKEVSASGSGLGLFVARQIIAQHGGDCIIDSREGRGSTFGFTIPISQLDQQPA